MTYLNAQEALKAAASNDTQLARVWDLWTRKIGPIEWSLTPFRFFLR